MHDVLVSQGLGVILKGKPGSMTDEEWEDYSARALSMIRLHLGQEVLLQVYTEDTPIKLWTRLETMYKKKFLSTRLYTSLKLMTYKMAEGAKLSDHIDAFNLIVAELASLDEQVEDEKKALFLLVSLPKSYQHLVQTILYGRTTLSYEEAVGVLLSDEVRKKIGESSSSSSTTALTVTRGRSKEKSSEREKARSRSRDSKNVECWKCGKKGHIKKHCKVNTSGDKALHQASVAMSDDEGFALCTFSHAGDTVWILDSACSYHMCPSRELFCSYEPQAEE
ncbi:unnamed protein product [Calypogeia fissa]